MDILKVLSEQIKENSSSRKKFITFVILVFISITVIIILNNHRIAINAKLKEKDNTLKSAEDFVKEYENNQKTYQKLREKARLIDKKEVDQIQNSIMQNIKIYDLDIQSMQPITTYATNNPEVPNNAYEVELTVLGKWQNTMQFLNNIQKDTNTLINLSYIRFDAIEAQKLKSIIRYKIYTN